jgi:hypothetical protein
MRRCPDSLFFPSNLPYAPEGELAPAETSPTKLLLQALCQKLDAISTELHDTRAQNE